MSVVDAMGGAAHHYASKSRPQTRVSADDFQLLRVIGQGGYGKVLVMVVDNNITAVNIIISQYIITNTASLNYF